MKNNSAIRSDRMKWVFVIYWIATLIIGVALFAFKEANLWVIQVANFASILPGVMETASHAFDPTRVQAFSVLSVSASVTLAIIACLYVPAGSHKVYSSIGQKLVFSTLAIVTLALSIGLLFKTNSISGMAGGRTSALLFIGSASPMGVVIIINVWYGFMQLFFFVMARAVLSTSVARR